MRRIIAAAVLMFGLATPAWAGFDEGWAAWKRGDYATALRELRPLAKQGNARAQYALGYIYEKGAGVPQSDAEALKWYRKAAEQGHADAKNNLGILYDHGQGVPQDDAEAVRWYREAAELGSASAQSNLGVMHGKGSKGVPQDYVQAHMWFNLAATQGDKTALKNRDIVAKRMTPAQIAEAQRLAREWLAKFEARKKKQK